MKAAVLRAPLARLDGSLDVVPAVGAFRREAIVGPAEQAQIFRHGVATLARGMVVVELQPCRAAAAIPLRVDPTAPESIPLEHHTSS